MVSTRKFPPFFGFESGGPESGPDLFASTFRLWPSDLASCFPDAPESSRRSLRP